MEHDQIDIADRLADDEELVYMPTMPAISELTNVEEQIMVKKTEMYILRYCLSMKRKTNWNASIANRAASPMVVRRRTKSSINLWQPYNMARNRKWCK